VEDVDLAIQAKQGDIDAYETLMRRHQNVAHRAAYLVTGDTAEAEDAVQEAFVKAYYALESFEDGRAFKPWLLRIVTNEAHSRRRSVARHARLALRAQENMTVQTMPSPESRFLASERSDTLIRELNKLPEIDRLMISYRYFLDLTPSEMAETFGKPPGAIRSRLFRALARLREGIETSTDLQSHTAPDGLKGTSHG
jgi:RNA polymerase sigma-70 factor (ECF subfamily)